MTVFSVRVGQVTGDVMCRVSVTVFTMQNTVMVLPEQKPWGDLILFTSA